MTGYGALADITWFFYAVNIFNHVYILIETTIFCTVTRGFNQALFGLRVIKIWNFLYTRIELFKPR